MSKISMSDERLMEIGCALGRVLDEYKADTGEVMALGEQLMISGFSQLARDNPKVNHAKLAHKIALQLLSRLQSSTALGFQAREQRGN